MTPAKKGIFGTVAVISLGLVLWRYSPESQPVIDLPQLPAQPESVEIVPAAPMIEFLSENELVINAPQMKLKRKDISIKSLEPGLTEKQIRAKLGPPISISDEPPYHDAISDKDLPLKIWRYDGLAIHILGGRAAQITAANRHWPTRKGLKVGDSLKRAVTLYGVPNEVRTDDLIYCWDPGASSFCPLTISISTNNVVSAIAYDGWSD